MNNGGQVAMRGYLVQTLIALLDSLESDQSWNSVTIEPAVESDKVDILWETDQGTRAVQVKSSQNPFRKADVDRWAKELAEWKQADTYELILVGTPASDAVARIRKVGTVDVPPLKNLDLNAFKEQAAHRLDRVLKMINLPPGDADQREMLAGALAEKLATLSTTGSRLTRSDLLKLLTAWISKPAPATVNSADPSPDGTAPDMRIAEFEHEVFVSYATVDDRPSKNGWVASFVSSLSESLAAAFGKRDSDRIWWDRSNIDEAAPLTKQIRSKVMRSACLVVILSRGYIESDWCRREREAFLAAVASRPDGDRRVFLVDIGSLELSERPDEFRDLAGHIFYVQLPNTTSHSDKQALGFPIPDPLNKDHIPFFTAVDRLSKAVYERVSELRGTPPVILSKRATSDITVFVAESPNITENRITLTGNRYQENNKVLLELSAPPSREWIQEFNDSACGRYSVNGSYIVFAISTTEFIASWEDDVTFCIHASNQRIHASTQGRQH